MTAVEINDLMLARARELVVDAEFPLSGEAALRLLLTDPEYRRLHKLLGEAEAEWRNVRL